MERPRLNPKKAATPTGSTRYRVHQPDPPGYDRLSARQS